MGHLVQSPSVPGGCFGGCFLLVVPRSGERGGWKGRGSGQALPKLPALAQLCHSLQLVQQDGYVLPCRKSPCSGIRGRYRSSVGLAMGREP